MVQKSSTYVEEADKSRPCNHNTIKVICHDQDGQELRWENEE